MFIDGDGGGILANINKNDSCYEKYYRYDPSSVDFDLYVTIFDNTTKLVQAAVECYEKKIYYFQGNLLNVNFELEKDVFRKYNQFSDYWKY